MDFLILAAVSLIVGFGEELVFRGYILSRWRAMSGSATQAVAVSAILFAIVHAYQGLTGILHAALLGFIYGLAFLYMRRLWPLVIAHALMDFISLSALS